MPKIKWQPNPGPQTAFLASTAREVLYGGAAGGGKTDALLALPLRWADHPKHRALMMRRTRPDLQEMIDRTFGLYPDIVPGAEWRENESRWKFPSGAMIQMGYAEHAKDIMKFKSFEYNLICFDELTSFEEQMYLFMLLRNRTKSSDLPPMIRSATNPGDIGHDWVFRRFIEHRTPYVVYPEPVEVDGRHLIVSRQFVPSRVWDNPSLPNRDEYIAGIMQMSPEDVAAYLYGEWTQLAGAMFRTPLVVAEYNQLLDPSDYYVVRAVDFGIEDPTCVLWLIHYPRSNVIDIAAELYLRETTLDAVVKAVKYVEEQMRMRPPLYSLGSPEMVNTQATSNQSIASMMSMQGVSVEKGNTDRKAGWARIQNLLQRGALRVWPGGDGVWGAPNLQRTLPRMQRKTGLNQDPNDIRGRQEDHAVDALRYGVMGIYDRIANVPKPMPVDEPDRDTMFEKMRAELQKGNRGVYVPDLG